MEAAGTAASAARARAHQEVGYQRWLRPAGKGKRDWGVDHSPSCAAIKSCGATAKQRINSLDWESRWHGVPPSAKRWGEWS